MRSLLVFLFLAVLLPLAGGCQHASSPTAAGGAQAGPADPMDLALAGLFFEGAAFTFQESADDPATFLGCVLSVAAATTLDVVAGGLAAEAEGTPTYPEQLILHDCVRDGDAPPTDVADVVEGLLKRATIVGRMILERYGSRLRCVDKARIDAAIRYVDGLIEPVIGEVENPDGRLMVPETPVSFAQCEG